MTQVLTTITSEGGLLPSELLLRIFHADKTVPGLRPEDYRIDPGQRLGEAISRAWNRMVPAWRAFRAECEKLPAGDPATTPTRERFLQPLFHELGFGRVPTRSAIKVDDREYAITHGWGEVPVHIPIHMLGAGVSLDDKQKGVAGAARSSPHGLVQDLLNRSQPHLWAIVTNGLRLRLLRDHHSLTGMAYVEVDLEALFEGERYADFSLVWMLFHQSRFEAAKLDECWLETWFKLARDQGVSALDDLREGVEHAIAALGRGFLRHRANAELKRALTEGELDRQDYYRELLRLVYRLIFLFSAEERGVLLDPAAPAAARERYARFYGNARLRQLAGNKRGGPHGDLWQGLRTVMAGLATGCPPLALPALGSFLWSTEALPHLGDAELANEDLLAAVRALSYLQRDGQRFPVSWRTVAADELGSIYEGLLELHPRLDTAAGSFELNTAAGHDRKKTGSYYTPTSLVDCLLDTALDPVIDDAVKGKRRDDAERALLGLKVVDPACGSGHFLVAAARRLARRLANVRTGDDEPSPREQQRAIRDVVGRCIYGVDLNEMAVELCKVALWMEAVEPGKPLSFLDAHIQHGNALLGATPALMARGIPDDAWAVLEGDDKDVAKALKKRNREARRASEKGGQGAMWDAFASSGGAGGLAAAARDALGGGDGKLEEVQARARRWATLQSSQAFRDAVFVADCWCAAFVWKKAPGELAAEAPTHEVFERVRRDPASTSRRLRREVSELAGGAGYSFFHWHLAFPEVFWAARSGGAPTPPTGEEDVLGWEGGFDVVLGNPPWERVKLQEKEFFAGRSEAIAGAENAAVRKRLIARLPEQDPALWAAWTAALRRAEGESHWMRTSGRYPLCGQGDINTYSIFAELNRSLMAARARVGCILPSGIATDDTTKEFFAALVTCAQLASLFHFENEEFVFPEVHHAFRFCLVTMAAGRPVDAPSDMVFYARKVVDLSDPERQISLTAGDFLNLNPNTRTCPTFRSRRDAEINKAIYRRVPVLWNETTEDGNPWGVSFLAMLHMSGDSEAFRDRATCERDGFRLDGNVYVRGAERRLPLYEAKMVHHFDHRFATYEGQTEAQANQGKCPELSDADRADPTKVALPYYWVDAREVAQRLDGRWAQSWLLGWRDICRASDIRTAISSVLPRTGCGDTYLLMMPSEQHCRWTGSLLANVCSLVFDYTARQKVGGTHLKYNVMRQLPVLPPSTIGCPIPWDFARTAGEWLGGRAAELVFTAHELTPFARDVGYDGPPFRWDPSRRAILRAELDAAFFHLYGIDRSDTEYILDTFRVLRDKEAREHGEYRTRRLVLERYDALAAAIASGTPYVTPLDPPPADPRAAHPG